MISSLRLIILITKTFQTFKDLFDYRNHFATLRTLSILEILNYEKVRDQAELLGCSKWQTMAYKIRKSRTFHELIIGKQRERRRRVKNFARLTTISETRTSHCRTFFIPRNSSDLQHSINNSSDTLTSRETSSERIGVLVPSPRRPL